MHPCCEKFALLEWRGGGGGGGWSLQFPCRASTWQTKYPQVTFADEIALFKIFDVANMRQCHWIRDTWFVLLDILTSNKTFRSAFQVINEILPVFKNVLFSFYFALSEKYFWYISEDNSIYSSSMPIKFRYCNRQMFLSTLSGITCGYDGYWTDMFSKLTTPLQSSWWCRDMATLAT